MTDDQNRWSSDSDRGQQPTPGPPPGYGPQPLPPQQYPPQYPAYPGYGQPGFGPVAQTNSKATTSMVLGIVGLASMVFCYGVLSIVLGPIAFFMGRSAQKEMEVAPSAWSNAGMAKAGWIMGLIQTVLSVIAIAAIAAFIIWVATTDDSNF